MKYDWDCSKYKIYSRSGEYMDEIIAESKTDALFQLLKKAGYKCQIDHEIDSDHIIYDDEVTERICGQVENWTIEKV